MKLLEFRKSGNVINLPSTFQLFLLRKEEGCVCRLFMEPSPATLSPEEARLAAESLTFTHINKWVEATGKHEARITRWECFNPNSPLYLKIGKPLLSIRTTGSITVERVSKPLKNNVLTKERTIA